MTAPIPFRGQQSGNPVDNRWTTSPCPHPRRLDPLSPVDDVDGRWEPKATWNKAEARFLHNPQALLPLPPVVITSGTKKREHPA